MMDFVLWGLAVVGATDIIVAGTIFKEFREWAKDKFFLKNITTCHQCASFHVSYILAIMLKLSEMNIKLISPLCFLFLLACAGSYLAPLGRTILDWFILSVNVNLDTKDE